MVRIPLLVVISKERAVILGTKLARNQAVLSMRKYESAISVAIIENLHVVATVGQIQVDLAEDGGLDSVL